jgi:hypothetical protein
MAENPKPLTDATVTTIQKNAATIKNVATAITNSTGITITPLGIASPVVNLLRRSFTTTCVCMIVFMALIGLTSIVADRSNAEQPRASSCAEKLQRFVVSIDELLSKKVLQHEPYWAVIREYLPPKGCTVEEVISISRTSKFFASPFEEYAAYTIIFKDSDTVVSFGLQKGTGNTEYPNIGSTHLPSW